MNEETSEAVAPPLFPLSFWRRFLYGAFVIIMPVVDFSFEKFLQPDWQTGKFSDHISLFLSPQASVFFLILLAYSVISYILFLWDETRYGKKFIIRFGVYTGVILALQYSVLSFMVFSTTTFSGLVLIVACVLPFLIKGIYVWFTKSWSTRLFWGIFTGVLVVILIITGILMKNILGPFFILIFMLGASAPFWSFLLAGQISLWLFKHYESKYTLLRGLGGVAWVSAYIFAMRFNILKMYELYSALPPQPPDCYIATAAAKGHPRVVGSRTIAQPNGSQMRVNSQLQRLKCVELAILAVFPKVHRLIRGVYDVLGKKLAAYIQNPILADVAYLFLVPVEWISFLILKIFIPEIQDVAKKIYRS